jgi:hypothetical protein
LKETLAQLQKEIIRREPQLRVPAQAPLPAPSGTPDEQPLKELRQKVDLLKSALKERHNERNELRRELQQAHVDLETIRQHAAPVASLEDETPDREAELWFPPDAPEGHPVRLIEFPKNFQQTLGTFPRHVARATIVMTGRLAAGDPPAYVGCLRLKATPNVMRQRIGADYRLLFRLWPDRLEVVDLINRKDLDRRIKALA